jgi:hypothetical protein
MRYYESLCGGEGGWQGGGVKSTLSPSPCKLGLSVKGQLVSTLKSVTVIVDGSVFKVNKRFWRFIIILVVSFLFWSLLLF